MNYSRLKMVRILTGKHFVVEVLYKNDKSATFSVDRGKLNDKQLLEEAFRATLRQIES